MHVIRLIGGFAAISIVAATLVLSLKSVPKAVENVHRMQKPASSAAQPVPAAALTKEIPAAPGEEKKPERLEEASRIIDATAGNDAAFPATAASPIHKCIENGKVTYTSAHCPATSTTAKTVVPADPRQAQ